MKEVDVDAKYMTLNMFEHKCRGGWGVIQIGSNKNT